VTVPVRPRETAGGRPAWRVELARYRQMTDPDADALVARFRAANPDVTGLRDLVRGVIAELAEAKARGGEYEGPLGDVFDLAPVLPGWAGDTALIRRGQAVFNDNGLDMGTALCFAGLPVGYASVDGAEALARTSDLATGNLTRRIGETGQMLIDVMGTRDGNGLEPGGVGYATAVGLRLLHGCVRSLLADPSAGPVWPVEDFGPPLNQEIMLATLLDFTVVVWAAMERIGTVLSTEDRRAHLYVWSIVGHVMGIEACRSGPLELCDLDELIPLLERHVGDTPSGRRLMGGLLGQFESYMPLGWRKLPRSVVHWLFDGAPNGFDRVPALLGVRPPAWWSRPVFRLMRASHGRRLLGPLRPILDWITRRAGRLVILGFADGFAPDAPPFRVPEPLARSWRLRIGGLPRRVRALRHRARAGARRALPQRRPVGPG
jgi:ER-bound oxygenase mpaB/B'/Rubber oxygenase, catalytic domain